ncbi:hypothetical protein [Clostridium sp.]|uniref:hypothetical protein n=1 Tax=Clostridium sp. TaxID=1506 RepID=UPI001A399CFC|nr:hypothetical protein [Clostridium sp.]MBK5239829.1 hypothetical protein [Clostridium sp.]
MGKKIIIIFSIMMLSIMMFGCATDSLKIPNKLELKDEYRDSVSTVYADNFNNCTSHAIYMYKNIENLSMDNSSLDDLRKSNSLYKTLFNSKDGSDLSDTEKILTGKILDITGDMIVISGDELKEKYKTELIEHMKLLLDLYK